MLYRRSEEIVFLECVLLRVLLLNLIILIGFTLHTGGREIAFLDVSIAFAFAQFTVIVIISLIKVIFNMRYKCMRRNGYHLYSRMHADSSDEMVHERVEDPEIREQNVHNLRNTVIFISTHVDS